MCVSSKQLARTIIAFATGAMLIGCGLARAADMPDLIGVPWPGSVSRLPGPNSEAPRSRWDGIYFGALTGRSFTTANFGSSSSSQVSYILANTELESIVPGWTNLPKATTGTMNFGGFAGFNTHWEDIVGSLELNYNHIAASLAAGGSVGPIIVPGAALSNGDTVQYSVTVNSTASVALKDVLTARGRLGWSFERFLPYAFVGLALGRAEVARTTSVTGTKSTTDSNNITTTGALILPRNPQSDSRSLIAYGFTGGLGVDVDLLPNVFLRGEWEYTGFASINDVQVNLNSVRAGIGLRF